MEVWQYLAGLVAAGVVGGFIKEKFFANPAAVTTRISNLESKVAVLQETKLTEPQVRGIVHEQLQPLMVAIQSMQQEQAKQSNLLARIDERLEKQEREH